MSLIGFIFISFAFTALLDNSQEELFDKAALTNNELCSLEKSGKLQDVFFKLIKKIYLLAYRWRNENAISKS